jgi:hypothetical protein
MPENLNLGLFKHAKMIGSKYSMKEACRVWDIIPGPSARASLGRLYRGVVDDRYH